MKSEEFDELFRREVNGLEGLPPHISWSKEAGWEKLNARLLHSSGKKMIIPFWSAKKLSGSYWVYAAAAAITVMLVSVYAIKSNWVVADKHPGMNIVAATQDFDQPGIDSSQPDQPMPEKSILFHESLNEMDADKMKDGDNPFLIADPKLKSQLLIYNHFIHHYDKAKVPDFQQNIQAVLPLVINGLSRPEFLPPYLSIVTGGDRDSLKKTGIDARAGRSMPMTLILKGNLAAIDQSFNVGLEGSVLFKLPNPGGKRNMLGIGVDAKYQFHSSSAGDQSLDGLSVSEKGKIKNGINTFVTASYSHNLSQKEKKPFWVGMKVGYLVQDNTNSFDDNTLMLEMIVGGNDSSKFKISSQVYLTDNLKKVMPGIKLGMSLGKFEKDVSI